MSQTNGCATGESYKFIYTRKRELSFIKIASKIPYIVNDVCMFVGDFPIKWKKYFWHFSSFIFEWNFNGNREQGERQNHIVIKSKAIDLFLLTILFLFGWLGVLFAS